MFQRSDSFESGLNRQLAAGLLRVEQVVEKPDASRIRLSTGRVCIDFSSNSYLGLHGVVGKRSARRFLKEGHQTTAGSSRMVSGTRDLHRSLESDLADFVRSEDAAVYGSGFLCCAGVVATLTGSRDRILFDEKIHASLRAGTALSTAEKISYRHADLGDLKSKLSGSPARGRTWILTDGLFSMDGDFAPLDGLADMADRRGAWLIVDDAHGIGAVGRSGRGTFERFGRTPGGRLVLIGTLSKTLASYGGFVAADSSVIRFIKARSKEFIYTTASPPFQVIAAQEALSIVRSGEGRRLRRKLESNVRALGRAVKRKLNSPIVPIPISGGPDAVVSAARTLWDQGCFAVGMRYPTVPRGHEMIRVSLSAAHTDRDIKRLAAALLRL